DIDSWVEGDTRIVVAAGDVEFKRGTQSFKADNAILWFGQDEHSGSKIANFKEFYAEGNVTIIATGAEDEIKHADKAFENIAESKGFFVNPRFKIISPALPLPLYVGGKEMKQITPDEFEIRDGYTTSCSFGYPHFHIKSSRVKIKRRVDSEGKSYSEIKAYDNVFYIGDLPAGYLPVYKYDTRRKEALLAGYGAGSSNRFGTYVTTEWNPYVLPFIPSSLADWSDLSINASYLHKRGPALGSEFDYRREDIGLEGFLQTFYVNDKLGRDEATPREEFSNRNRGRILWRNRLHITDDLRADSELSYLSDRDFLREYFEKEFLEGKPQETYFNLRRLKDNRGATFLVKNQLNDFQTGLEAYPLGTYEAIGQPLFDNRLNLTSKSGLGYLEFQIDEGLETRNKSSFDKLTATTGSSVRFDTDNTVSMPFTLKMLKLNPFVGNRITAYSKSLADGGPNGSATGRYIGKIGFEGSAQLWRVYSLENKLLRINGLRHIITPVFRWVASPVVTKSPDYLLQYERSDGLDTYNSAIIGLRNRLQTRRGPPWKTYVIDLLEFNTELHLYGETTQPEDKEVTYTMMTAEGSIIPRRHSYLQFDLRAQPTNRLAMTSVGNEFDFKSRALEVFNLGLSFRKSENWSYFAGYRFIKSTSSTVILGANVLVGEKWRANFSESFDLGARTKSGDRTAKNLFSNFSFTRESHDWVAGINVSFDIANRDKSVGFVLTPKGIRRSLGSGYSFKGRTAEALP
ncbi:MAG: LPS assembly protein LptD, partial [Candidatus Brocadiales bacterium]